MKEMCMINPNTLTDKLVSELGLSKETAEEFLEALLKQNILFFSEETK
jgi:hypothetical protein